MTTPPPREHQARTAPHPLRTRAALVLAAISLAVLSGCGGGGGDGVASARCRTLVEQIESDLAAIAPPAGTKLTPDEQEAAVTQAQTVFANATEQVPECETAIANYQTRLATSARKAAEIKGTPFWGPIGWAWNSVYYKVFSGNDIMMGFFGWALLLSPLILVVSAVWVLRGSKGAFHRPYVPPHLRTEQ
jgi:hypothetical protein